MDNSMYYVPDGNSRAGARLAVPGAFLPGGLAAMPLSGTDAVGQARPRDYAAAAPFARCVPAPVWASGEQSARRQDSPVKHLDTTRIAVADGDASGSHPAWDPV